MSEPAIRGQAERRRPAMRRAGPLRTRADSFYDPRRRSAAEAARLRTMAAPADEVSLAALGDLENRDGIVVADLGAGDSTSLGSALRARNPSLHYLPIDTRPDAVEAQRAKGFHGRVGSVTDLPLRDRSVDVVHARFLFGWLDPGGCRRAVEEILRVVRGPARLVVIDYDWGSATGPEPLLAWKDGLLDLLSMFGFDPKYGQRLTTDLTDHLSDASLTTGAYTINESRATHAAPLRAVLPTVSAQTEPVLCHLGELGLDDRAEHLRELHAAVLDLAQHDPDAPVSFPAMVATRVDLSRGALAAAIATEQRRIARSLDPTHRLAHAGPAGLDVFRLESDELIAQARRVQAAGYLRHGYNTPESIDEDGFLIAEVDPPDVVARSAYLGVLDAEGHVAACVRMIRPADRDLATLPTLDKVSATRLGEHPRAFLPFSAGSVVFEVSGLARSSRCPDPWVATRLLLAVVSEARRLGDDYGVMGLVEPMSTLLLSVYGRQAIRPLDVGSVHLSGTGIRPGGVTLVPCYSETLTFVSDLMDQCRTRSGDRFGRLTRPLVELTALEFADHRARVRSA